MRRFVLALLVLASACGGARLPGAEAAQHHVYPVPLADARAVAGAVLWRVYGRAAVSHDPRYVAIVDLCRTWAEGGMCFDRVSNPSWEPRHKQIPNMPASYQVPYHYYRLDVIVELDGDDGAAEVRVLARVRHGGETHYLGDPDAPAWLQRDVDTIQVAIDHALTHHK